MLRFQGPKLNQKKWAFIAAGMAITTIALPSFAATSGQTYMDAVNAANTQKQVGASTKGAAVLRAQIMLDRAHFSTGEIDGVYGSNMRKAISGYQKKSGLGVSGKIDAATWTMLNLDAGLPLVSYTIQESDVAGPFNATPEDMAEKAKMSALGFASAEEGLGEKFHISPALLKRLNPGKDLTRANEEIIVPNVLDIQTLVKAEKIIVDQASGTLTLIDAQGKVMAQYPASTGSSRDPLPVGTWKVNGVSVNPVYYYNPALFWDAEADEKKAKIPAGPNNPVGVAWVALSKAHYGIHGTPVPSMIGKTQSHGCIRLTNWNVKSLTQSVSTGTQVILQ